MRIKSKLAGALLGGAWLLLSGGVRVSAVLPVASLERDSVVDFEEEILPLFNANCLACHNQTKAKAGLILEDPQQIRLGGDSGSAVVPARPEESLLFQAAAHLDEDLVMPPVGNKSNANNLTPEDLALLRLWIAQGATGDVSGQMNLAWQSVASRVQPVYSMAVSRTGRYVAYGRGSEARVYEVPTRREVGRLHDPALGNRSHLDLVNAVAIHPDGNLIATGGFREVKLWERVPMAESFSLVDSDGGRPDAVVISGDGLALVAGYASGRVTAREVSTGEVMWDSGLEVGGVRELAVNNDGDTILASSLEGKLFVRRKGTWRVLRGGVESTTHALSVSPSGRTIAAVLADGGLCVWRLDQAGDFDVAEPLGLDQVKTIAFSGEEGLFIGTKDGTIEWIDRSGTKRDAFKVDIQPVGLSVDFSGERVLVAGIDGNASLWNVSRKERVAELLGARLERRQLAERSRLLRLSEGDVELATQEGERLSEELSKERERVVAADKDLEIKRNAAQEGETLLKEADTALAAAKKSLQELDQELQQAEERVRQTASLAQAADDAIRDLFRKRSNRVPNNAGSDQVTIDERLEVALKRVREVGLEHGHATTALEALQAGIESREKGAQEGVKTAEAGVKEAATKQAGAQRALSLIENELALAHKSVDALSERIAASDKSLVTARERAEQAGTAVALARETVQKALRPFRDAFFSSDGTQVMAVTEDGAVSVWWAATGEELDHIDLALSGVLTSAPLTEHAVAIVGHLGDVRVVSMEHEWRLRETLGASFGFSDRVLALDFSADGTRLAAGGGDPSRSGEIMLWDLPGLTRVHTLSEVHSDVVFGLQFSPDGRYLASGSADRFARVIDLASGEVFRSLEGHTHYVMDVTWQANGRKLVSAGGDGMAKVWDVVTGERTKNIEGFKKEVTGVGFLGEGEEVLASSGDATLAVYGLDGKQVRVMEGSKAFIFSESVSTDGRLAAAGSLDGVLRLWDVSTGKVLTTLE